MKNKKILVIVVGIALLISLLYYFKPTTMNDIYDKPNFSGEVIEVYDRSILVSVDEGEEEYKSSDKISVSLDVKLKDSNTKFKIGDKVKVFYDGTIAESYPAQVNTVYAILNLNKE